MVFAGSFTQEESAQLCLMFLNDFIFTFKRNTLFLMLSNNFKSKNNVRTV